RRSVPRPPGARARRARQPPQPDCGDAPARGTAPLPLRPRRAARRARPPAPLCAAPVVSRQGSAVPAAAGGQVPTRRRQPRRRPRRVPRPERPGPVVPRHAHQARPEGGDTGPRTTGERPGGGVAGRRRCRQPRKARLNDPERPLASFLFLGPTGVGKTQCAKALATYLFGDAEKLIRFDMNEFIEPGAAARLVGTFYSPEGLLTAAVRR